LQSEGSAPSPSLEAITEALKTAFDGFVSDHEDRIYKFIEQKNSVLEFNMLDKMHQLTASLDRIEVAQPNPQAPSPPQDQTAGLVSIKEELYTPEGVIRRVVN